MVVCFEGLLELFAAGSTTVRTLGSCSVCGRYCCCWWLASERSVGRCVLIVPGIAWDLVTSSSFVSVDVINIVMVIVSNIIDVEISCKIRQEIKLLTAINSYWNLSNIFPNPFTSKINLNAS